MKEMTLTTEVFPKLRTPKNVVTSTSKKSCFRGTFEKQHGKRAKYCSNLNDSTFSIFIDHWEGNDLLKVSISDTKNLRLFVNTLTADQKYSLLNRDSLTQPTQMQLSQNEKIFVRIFFSTFEI